MGTPDKYLDARLVDFWDMTEIDSYDYSLSH